MIEHKREFLNAAQTWSFTFSNKELIEMDRVKLAVIFGAFQTAALAMGYEIEAPDQF